MRYAVALNRSLDVGVQLNALGHVVVGLAHHAPAAEQSLRTFVDRRRRFVGAMSDDPLIVLSGHNSAALHDAFVAAEGAGLVCNAFVLDMKQGLPEAQESLIASKARDDLVFVAVGCWGESAKVRAAFRRFSLYG